MAFTGGYQSFAVDHTKIGGADISNYIVRIIGTFANLKTTGNGGKVANGSGFDIRPYPNTVPSGALTYKLISYVPTTGFVHMLVLLPTAHTATDDPIYLFCGDAALNTDGSGDVFPATYLAALELPDGTTLSVADISGNARDGTNNGATAVAGPFNGGTRGGAAAFTTSQNISVPNAAIIGSGNVGDISCWVKRGTGTGIGAFWGHRKSGNGLVALLTAAGNLAFLKAGIVQLDYASYPQNTNWHKVETVFDAAGMRIYVDGVQVATNANTNNLTIDSNVVQLAWDEGDNIRWAGSMAAWRSRDTVRTAAHIAAEYANDSAPDTFVVSSGFTDLGGGTAAVTGTGAAGAVGNDIRAGGKTLILTLTGDTFNVFDDTIRAAIRTGLVSAGSATWGWNNVKNTIIPLANIVRTSSTVCTITFAAAPGYQIDANEVITSTIPASAVVLAAQIVATPTVTISKTSTNLSPVTDYTMTGTAVRTR